MNYDDVERIINSRGLESDPAVRDVGIAISNIPPDENGTAPLGLYFPDDALVVVPPSLPAQPGEIGESVLLHELGHRHGHFYRNDISEMYAELYRHKYQQFTVPDEGGTDMPVKLSTIKPCFACKASNSLCPFCEYGGYSVGVGYRNGIYVPDTAIITGSIDHVRIVWRDQTVTKVPQGEKFDIDMFFSANNPGGGQWCVAGTVISNDGALANYEIAKNNGFSTSMGGAGQWITLNKFGQLTMPDHDIALSVTLWGYPQYNDSPPNRSAW